MNENRALSPLLHNDDDCFRTCLLLLFSFRVNRCREALGMRRRLAKESSRYASIMVWVIASVMALDEVS